MILGDSVKHSVLDWFHKCPACCCGTPLRAGLRSQHARVRGGSERRKVGSRALASPAGANRSILGHFLGPLSRALFLRARCSTTARWNRLDKTEKKGNFRSENGRETAKSVFRTSRPRLRGCGQGEQNTASPLLSVGALQQLLAAVVPSTRTWETQSPPAHM